MAKVRRRPKGKARRTRTPQSVRAWIEQQFLAIPGLRERVDTMMREMLRKQPAGPRRKPDQNTTEQGAMNKKPDPTIKASKRKRTAQRSTAATKRAQGKPRGLVSQRTTARQKKNRES